MTYNLLTSSHVVASKESVANYAESTISAIFTCDFYCKSVQLFYVNAIRLLSSNFR